MACSGWPTTTRDAIMADYVLTESAGLHTGPSEQPFIGINVGEKGVAWRRLRVHVAPLGTAARRTRRTTRC